MQNIGYRRENPHSFIALAEEAAALERAENYSEAEIAWSLAKGMARNPENFAWATGREDKCRKLK